MAVEAIGPSLASRRIIFRQEKLEAVLFLDRQLVFATHGAIKFRVRRDLHEEELLKGESDASKAGSSQR